MVRVLLEGKPLAAGPQRLLVRRDETVAAHCAALGAGVTAGVAGEPCRFEVQAVDGKRAMRCCGGDRFAAVATAPDGSRARTPPRTPTDPDGPLRTPLADHSGP